MVMALRLPRPWQEGFTASRTESRQCDDHDDEHTTQVRKHKEAPSYLRETSY